MTFDADMIVERRRLARGRTFWRVIAFLAIAVALIAGFAAVTSGRDALGLRGAHIARVSINGVIRSDRKKIKLIRSLGESKSVKAVIIAIDSPGGTTTGGEALYNEFRKLSEKKPVVATVDTLAASAGYMVATAADRIFVRRNSITGSIGVLFQYPEFAKLLDTVGVKVNEVKSGNLKAEPSPFSQASDEAKAVLADLVEDSYSWFVDLVAERRGIPAASIRAQKGRIYTGNQAVSMKLVDEIGGEQDAIDWLVAEKGIPKDTPVKDRKPERAADRLWIARLAAIWFLGSDGSEELGQALDRINNRVWLDGLVSVWHAQDMEIK